MSRCDVAIRLESTDGTVSPDQPIRGTVVVTADEAIPTNGVSLSFRWETTGWADRSRGREITKHLGKGTLAVGENAYPFELVAPRGPFTYSGRNVSLEWRLRASVDVSWASDPCADATIRLVPGTAPVAYDLGKRVKASPVAPPTTGQEGCHLAVGIGVVLAGVGGAFVPTEPPDRPLALALAAIVAVGGLAIVVWSRWNAFARRKLGEVALTATPAPVHRGETLAVSVKFSPRAPLSLARATATLVARENVRRDERRHRDTALGRYEDSRTEELSRHELELASGRSLAAGETVALSGAIALPDDAPTSFDVEFAEVEWTLTVKLAIAGWPDYERSMTVYVLPPGGSL